MLDRSSAAVVSPIAISLILPQGHSGAWRATVLTPDGLKNTTKLGTSVGNVEAKHEAETSIVEYHVISVSITPASLYFSRGRVAYLSPYK